MAVQPTQPQSIGGVLDSGFQLYKASVGVVWPLCLLLIVAGSPPTIYLVMSGGAAGLAPADMTAALVPMMRPGYALANLLGLLLSMWVFGALLLKMHSIGVGIELGSAAALRAAVRRAPWMLVLTLLFILALVAGFMLLAVPGFILSVSLILCWVVLMIEHKGPLAALTASHQLVWGHWWRTAAILTVGFIVVFVIYLAVGMLGAVVLPLVAGSVQDVVIYAVISIFAVNLVVSLLVTPFYVALLLTIYWDLKLRKEGGDLAARVSSLGAA